MSFLPFQDTSSIVRFADRHAAGEQLAQAVLQAAKQFELAAARFVVYALPKGGLPIALPIAHCLGCPLDVIVAKKLPVPIILNWRSGLSQRMVTSSGTDIAVVLQPCLFTATL